MDEEEKPGPTQANTMKSDTLPRKPSLTQANTMKSDTLPRKPSLTQANTMKSDTLPRKQSAVWTAIKHVQTKLSLTEEGATPCNWKVISLVFISLFSSSFNITFLFPFLPEMILWFGYKEEDKGYYAGIVASALFIGRTFGSYFWGWLSDKKGRKPIILITLLLNGFFSLLFGFTTHIYMAFIFRLLSGLSNGTVGTVKSVLYEISDNTNQAVGMSIISMAWGSGLIIGPAVGGYLANPCRRYPTVFPSEGVFYQFPYILPGVFCFVICVAAVIADFFLLPETLNMKHIPNEEEDLEVVIEEDEKTSLYSSQHSLKITSPTNGLVSGHHSPVHNPTHLPSYLSDRPMAAPSVENLHVETEGATFLAGSRKEIHITCRGISFTSVDDDEKKKHSKARTTEDNKEKFFISSDQVKSTKAAAAEDAEGGDEVSKNLNASDALLSEKKHSVIVNGQGTAVLEKDNVSETESTGSGCWHMVKNWTPIKLITQFDVFIGIALYAIVSFGIIGTDEIFTVWASTDKNLDGLGFQPSEIGTVLGATSIPLLFIQLFMFPNLVRRLGIKKTMLVCTVLIMILTEIMPILHLIKKPVTLWVLLLTVYTILKLMTSCVFSCTGLFINNSVTPQYAGTVNGLSMTITACSRALSPLVGGSIFSWVMRYGSQNIGPPCDVSLVFFVFGLSYWVVAVMSVFTPEHLNRQKKQLEQKK